MKPVSLVPFLLVVGVVVGSAFPAGIARADTRESEYLAARRAAVAELKRISDDCRPANEKQMQRMYDEDRRLRADLEKRLIALLGSRPPIGFARGPAASPTMLACGLEVGGLDGLVFRRADDRAMVLTTTETLLRQWMSEQRGWRRAGDQSLGDALKSGALYTLAFGAAAGITPFTSVPVGLPPGTLGAVLLVEESQTRATRPPQRFAIGLVRGGRVRLALATLASPLAPIEACDRVLEPFRERARTAYDSRDFDVAHRIEDEGEQAYVACWHQRLPESERWHALSVEAQSILEMLLLP